MLEFTLQRAVIAGSIVLLANRERRQNRAALPGRLPNRCSGDRIREVASMQLPVPDATLLIALEEIHERPAVRPSALPQPL